LRADMADIKMSYFQNRVKKLSVVLPHTAACFFPLKEYP